MPPFGSRAALLPTPGDPFLLSYWLRSLTWRQLVDRIYIYVTHPHESEKVRARMTRDAESYGAQIRFATSYADHGIAMARLVEWSSENVLLFAEDDWYVTEPDVLSGLLAAVEGGSTDVVGVPRGSCSVEMLGTNPRPALCPWACITKRQYLLPLYEAYTPRTWAPGETVRGLNHTCREECRGDTFAAASMELIGGKRLHAVPQDGPWIHAGSLSTGPYVEGAPLADQVAINPQTWRTRAGWWRQFADTWPGGLTDEHVRYSAAVAAIEALC